MSKEQAQIKPSTGEDAVLLLVPTRGAVSHETLLSYEQNMGGVKYALIRAARKPVAEARNILAKTALECIASNPFPFKPRETFVLWVDDDAWLPPGLVPQMVQAMREPALQRLDALFAWFCTRTAYAKPVAYRRLDDPESFPKVGVDCKHGDVVPIEAAGFHCVIMRPSLLERIGPDPFTPEPGRNEGEDFAFCRRAKAIGATLAVGTSLPAAHVDPRDGVAYMVGMPAGMMDGNNIRALTLDHLNGSGSIKTGEVRQYGLGAVETDFADAEEKAKASLQTELAMRREVSNA